MAEEIKKYILNLCESELPAELLEICNDLSLTITADSNEASAQEYIYTIIDSDQSDLPLETPVLNLANTKNIHSFFEENGKGIVSPQTLSSEIGKILIKRLLGDSSSLSFEKAFDGGVQEAKTLKLENFFKVGSVCDILSKDAFSLDFNFIAIRNYFNSLASFYGVLSQSDVVGFPIEVDYGQSDDCFVVQTHVSIEDFNEKLLVESFGNIERLSPFQSLLNICTKQVDIFDCYILESSSRLVITGIWFKKENYQVEEHRASIFLNNIKSFKRIEAEQLSGTVEVTSASPDIEAAELQDKPFLETTIKEQILGPDISADNILSVKKIIEFIKKLRISEVNAKEESELNLDDIATYLKKYPNQKILEKITAKDTELILKGLIDTNIFELIQKKVKEAGENIEMDEFAQSFISKVESLSMGDACEIVSSAADSSDDEISRVSGWLGQNDDKTVIAGSVEESEGKTVVSGTVEEGEENTLVKGQREDLREESWSVKRSEMVEEIKNAVSVIKGDGKDINALEKEVMAVISGKLDIPEDDCMRLTRGLIDESVEPLRVKSLDVDTSAVDDEASAQHVRDRMTVEKLEGDLKLREGQLVRMKKVIDNMKIEVHAMRQFSPDLSSITNGDTSNDVEVTKVRAELSNTIKELETQKRAYENLKDANSNLNENNAKTVLDLENKIKNMEEEKFADTEGSNVQKIANLEQENQNLTTKLNVADKRIASLSENINDQVNNTEEKKSEIMTRMQERINMAQAALSKFRDEKEEMIKKISALESVKGQFEKALSSSKKETESGEGLNNDIMVEKDGIIDELSDSLKTAEESIKETTLKVKQLEQKNKFLTAQVDEAKKQAKKAKSGGGISGGGDPALQRKVKQLELVNEKIVKSNEKNAKDLIERKKESLKFKTEATKLQHKITELERKLAKAA